MVCPSGKPLIPRRSTMRRHMSGTRRMRTGAAIVAVAALTGGTAGQADAAGPGSLVFVKHGKVWVAKPDGSGARMITRGRRLKGFEHPTQADNGTVVTLRSSTRLYRFARSGRRLGKPRRVAPGLGNEG